MAIDGKRKTRYGEAVSDEDIRIGKNVAVLRGDRSQAEVAAAMRAAGHKWAQNTVSAVEAGERPLRLSEATELVNVLGLLSLSELTREESYATLRSWAHRTRESHDDLLVAADRFQECQINLAIVGDQAIEKGLPVTMAVDGWRMSWLTMTAAEAIRRHQADGPAPTDEENEERRATHARGDNGGEWSIELYDTLLRNWD